MISLLLMTRWEKKSDEEGKTYGGESRYFHFFHTLFLSISFAPLFLSLSCFLNMIFHPSSDILSPVDSKIFSGFRP